MLFNKYLEKVYDERMEGAPIPDQSSKEFTTGRGAVSPTTTYSLELAGNMIHGMINNQKINAMTAHQLAAKYPEITKEVLTQLKKDGAARYEPNDETVTDFIRNPQTKNTLQATPDK